MSLTVHICYSDPMLERFCKRSEKKEVTKPLPFILHSAHETRPLHTGEHLLVCDICDPHYVKIWIRTTKNLSKILIQVLPPNGQNYEFEWGMLERYKQEENGKFSKVLTFDHSLSSVKLILNKQTRHHDIEGTPLSFTPDSTQIHMNGKLLLEWHPTS